jgi:transposase
MNLTADQVQGDVLDHFGLVAATIERLGLIEEIDQRVPISQEKGAKVTIGERVAAMILNGLGFIDDRLYLFPQFLQNKPVDRLFHDGVSAADFNDDALGRGLDKLYAYGVTQLFGELAMTIGDRCGLLGRSVRLDNSTLKVYGEYETTDDGDASPAGPVDGTQEGPAAQPAYGYSKENRFDLKQMMLHLATTGESAFPVWMEAHSGHVSDKKALSGARERMAQMVGQLSAGSNDFLHVGDSAFYEGCLKQPTGFQWLTRVPETHGPAKALTQYPSETLAWQPLGDGYHMSVVENHHQGIHQRWAVIYSEQAYQKQVKTLERTIDKAQTKAEQGLKKLSHQQFQCQADADQAVQQLVRSWRYHEVDYTIEAVTRYPRKGRPKAGDQPETVGYRVQGQVVRDETKIEPIRRQKGRFILATNELDREKLPDEAMLSEYKSLSHTERGFQFIKDDTFEVHSIFLKKPERIEALMMVMTLCLMVYGVAEYDLSQSLKAHDETVTNQLNQPTQQPKMKWIFRLFQGVQRLRIQVQDQAQELVINLTEHLKQIIAHFGGRACLIYGLQLE